MKHWAVFVIATVFCWGAYVPILHHGQKALIQPSALRAFLFVGLAYLLVSGAVLAYLFAAKPEPLTFNAGGMAISTVAGVLGALGALGIVFAMKFGGKPIFVAPLVFAGAPIISTLVSMIWDKPSKAPEWPFYAGILLAAAGAGMVLRFKPT